MRLRLSTCRIKTLEPSFQSIKTLKFMQSWYQDGKFINCNDYISRKVRGKLRHIGEKMTGVQMPSQNHLHYRNF